MGSRPVKMGKNVVKMRRMNVCVSAECVYVSGHVGDLPGHRDPREKCA